MDEHTKIFIALGAATAANCGPCFQHYFQKAEKLGVAKEDIQKAVDVAVKVRGGAHMVMNGAIQRAMVNKNGASHEECCSGSSSCCDE